LVSSLKDARPLDRGLIANNVAELFFVDGPKWRESASATRFVSRRTINRITALPNNLAGAIHNADARVLDRNVQSRKIVHAALLLLMLEAAHADLVSPSA